MLNIFNLFLFLLALWFVFMASSGNISWLYLGFGIFSCALVAFFSYKAKLISPQEEMLYLSIGFYRVFLKNYLCNFFSSMSLLNALAFRKEPFKGRTFEVKINQKNLPNFALLVASINMMSGIFCVAADKKSLLIHAIEKDYFAKFNLKDLCEELATVNDDNLV